MSDEREGTVLVVDDERDVADVYAMVLRREFERVSTAYGGGAALEALDDDVDVVVLDRRMPETSGEEVLREIAERGHDCRVVFLTGADPDVDVADMPVDDYLCKPVTGEELVATVERLLRAPEGSDPATEFLRLTAKLSALREDETQHELGDSAEYARLRERARELRSELDADEEEFEALLRRYGDDADSVPL